MRRGGIDGDSRANVELVPVGLDESFGVQRSAVRKAPPRACFGTRYTNDWHPQRHKGRDAEDLRSPVGVVGMFSSNAGL